MCLSLFFIYYPLIIISTYYLFIYLFVYLFLYMFVYLFMLTLSCLVEAAIYHIVYLHAAAALSP